MGLAGAAGAGRGWQAPSIAQQGDFVKGIKAARAARAAGPATDPCSFGPFQCSGRSRSSGSVPCRESSFLAADLASHCGRGGVCVTRREKETLKGQQHARID